MWQNGVDNPCVVVVEPLDLFACHHGVVDQLGLKRNQGDRVKSNEFACKNIKKNLYIPVEAIKRLYLNLERANDPNLTTLQYACT